MTALAPIPMDAAPVNVRLVAVEDDTMEPTLRMGDAVIAVPTDSFSGEGVYLIDKGYPAVYRVSPCAGGKLSLYRDNKFYGDPIELTREEFDRLVIGKVGALVHVINRSVLGGTG